MNAFVDCFGSKHVQVHFDTGNVMLFQFPEHWIPILGRRIKNVHFKEFSKKGTDHSLESFRTLLDGTTNWPAVMDALEQTGYEGYVTFEYFHPFLHYPEALIEQSSDALDRILGRRARAAARVLNRSRFGRTRTAGRRASPNGTAHRQLDVQVATCPERYARLPRWAAAAALTPASAGAFGRCRLRMHSTQLVRCEQLAVGLVVKIRPLAGIAPQDPRLGLPLAVLGRELVPPAVDVERAVGPHERDHRAVGRVGKRPLEMSLHVVGVFQDALDRVGRLPEILAGEMVADRGGLLADDRRRGTSGRRRSSGPSSR